MKPVSRTYARWDAAKQCIAEIAAACGVSIAEIAKAVGTSVTPVRVALIPGAKERKLIAARQWRAANPDVARAAARRWRELNPQRARTSTSQWYRENRSKMRESAKAWRLANIEYSRHRSRGWNKCNRERCQENMRRWQSANLDRLRDQYRKHYAADPERFCEKVRQRKALKRAAGSQALVPVTAGNKRQRFAAWGHRCAYCNAAGELTVDHVKPLIAGGLDDLSNIVPACRRCNSSKCDRPVEIWYRAQPFFSEERLAKVRRDAEAVRCDR